MSADHDDLPERLEALETRLAFLERTVEQLDEAILDRGAQLERLERRLADLDNRVPRPEEGDPLDERPPHY
jgi:uncharacterized coiled-coil protein SlyX